MDNKNQRILFQIYPFDLWEANNEKVKASLVPSDCLVFRPLQEIKYKNR